MCDCTYKFDTYTSNLLTSHTFETCIMPNWTNTSLQHTICTGMCTHGCTRSCSDGVSMKLAYQLCDNIIMQNRAQSRYNTEEWKRLQINQGNIQLMEVEYDNNYSIIRPKIISSSAQRAYGGNYGEIHCTITEGQNDISAGQSPSQGISPPMTPCVSYPYPSGY